MRTAAIRENLAPSTLLALALLITGLYLLLHPYQGLVHDARLYTLQALNHLQPALYGNDVFLKYGSQDSYTLFTPLYAAAISLLGAERAASIATFLSIVALLVAAWCFARALMPSSLAWLGLGMLIVVPGFYGSGIVFAVLESFITPRLMAEALVLFALTAWLGARRPLSIALLLTGMLIHPIMSFPAVILLFLMGWGLQHWRALLPLAVAVLVLAAIAIAGWLPIERWQFDAAWWPMAERVPHLVLERWTLHDWARIATLLVTLGIGAATLPSIAARRLTVAMLATCVATLLLSYIGGDLLKIALVVQGQAWRSLWLATAIAVLLLPWIAISCWKGQPLQRCGLLLLAAAWALGPMSIALFFAIPAALAVACRSVRLPERYARIAVLGSTTLLAVAILCVLALAWTEYGSNLEPGATWLERVRTAFAVTVLPWAILLIAWYVAINIRSRAAIGGLTLTIALLTTVIGTASAASWLDSRYPQEARQAFAEWRSLIPEGADVLWSTKFMSGSDPMGAWLLLERPSYYSSVQINSGLFSRAAAMELRERGKKIPLSLPTEMPLDISVGGEAGEAASCAEIPVHYIVTPIAIPGSRVVAAPKALPPPFDQLQLHICP